jgi:hypothetical protein
VTYLLYSLAAARRHIETVVKDGAHAVREREKSDDCFRMLAEAQKSAVILGWEDEEAITEVLNLIIAMIAGKRKSSRNTHIPGSKLIHDPKGKQAARMGKRGKRGSRDASRASRARPEASPTGRPWTASRSWGWTGRPRL